MNAREEAMLDAVNDIADTCDDLLADSLLPADARAVIAEQRMKLRDVQDLYRHQAGRMSAPGGLYVHGPFAERTPPSCALPGLSAVLAPGGE
jgi:hypothetical protein